MDGAPRAQAEHAQAAWRGPGRVRGGPREGHDPEEEHGAEDDGVDRPPYDLGEPFEVRHGTRFVRFRPDKNARDCTWREVRPPRRRGDPTFESLLR